MKSSRIVAPAALLVLASACTGAIDDAPGGGEESTGAASAPSGASNPGSPGPGAGAPQTTPDGKRLICDGAHRAAASEGRRLTVAQYRNAIAEIFGGAVPPSPQYPGGYGTSTTGFSTEPGLNTIGAQGVDSVLFAAEDVALPVAGALPTLLPCAKTAAPGDACAGTFIDSYAGRAYRRRPTDDERQALMLTFHGGLASGASFTDAIAMLTVHMLQAPQFLYVMEGAAATPRALTSDEVASRLSFLLRDSIPDAPLLAAAAANELVDPARVAAQAARLLDSDRADATLARFFREWTRTVAVSPGSKDLKTYPVLTETLAASLNSSFDRFVSDQVHSQGTLHTLLGGNDGWVDTASAKFLGAAAPAAGAWKKVALDQTRYAGLVTQPAMMASLAHQQLSSFVLRGVFVHKELLCQEFGAPPPDAQAVFDALPVPANPTGRDRSEQILARAACAGCHGLINPPGLAFEHFDAIGGYQASYPGGKAIDTTGKLVVGGDSLTFANQVDLMKGVADRPEVARCFAAQIFRFAMSRMETGVDGCALQTIGDALAGSNGNLRTALLSMVSSDAFTWKVDP